MSNPHKPWARIDSTLQRQLGHYSHYGMPADNLSVVTPEPASTLEYIIPEYWTDPRDYIAYPVYHFTPGEYPQAPNIALLSQNVQPDSVPAEPQPITTFGEGFKQAFDQWKNNYSYGYGRFLKNINYEDEIRYGLQALDENPELSRGNVQEINRSIKTLRRGIAERQNRIEAGEGTPEDEAAILKDSEKIRGLYAMQQQYYKGATPEEAEAWRNDYIAQGGTGTQRMAEAIEEQKNYRPTKGWGTVGSIGWEIPKTLITAAATRNPITAPFAIIGGTGDAAIQNWARTNMQADLIEERTGEDVSTAQRLGQTALGAGVDIGTSLLLPMKGIRATQPFFNRLGKNIAAQGIAGGIGSASNDIGQNLILGDDLTAGDIASNALRGAAIGAMTGLGTTAVGHAMNKAGTRKIFREIPDESGMINGTTNAHPDNLSIPDIGYYRFNRPIRVERSTLSPIVRNAIENEGLHIDNTPVRIPFATYRRGPLAAPGTYVRPYQNPGTIDPNGLTYISPNKYTVPYGRYTLSYPLPEGMENTTVRIPFATYRRKSLAAPGTYVRPYQNPGTIDPNSLRMIPRESDPNEEFSPVPIERNGNLGREPEPGASSSEANDTRTPFSAYEDMFGIDKLGDGDKKTKTQRGERLKIQIEDTTYTGTGTEIMDRLRDRAFDPTEFPDTDTYIWFLQNNVIRTTGMECPLPDGSTECRARAMIKHLERIGALILLEE